MGGQMRKVIFMTLLFTIALPHFDAVGADWKFFGGTMVSGEKMLTFYDAESSKYTAGTVKVWVESIGQSEFNTKMKMHKKQNIEKAAEKVVSGYSPPYSSVNKKTSYDDSIEVISWEELANSSVLQPRAKLLFEINCKDKKIRTLTGTSFKNDGDITSSTKASEWNYISPESNGETLQKILCK
jgi:hypothetical protein